MSDRSSVSLVLLDVLKSYHRRQMSDPFRSSKTWGTGAMGALPKGPSVPSAHLSCTKPAPWLQVFPCPLLRSQWSVPEEQADPKRGFQGPHQGLREPLVFVDAREHGPSQPWRTQALSESSYPGQVQGESRMDKPGSNKPFSLPQTCFSRLSSGSTAGGLTQT